MIRKSFLRTMICVVLIGCLLACGAQAAIAAPSGNQYAKDEFITELRPGMSGGQVKQYQERLVYYGYPAPVNGKFDNATTLATKYFQAANKGKTTGIASAAVRKFINKDTGPVTFEVYEAHQATAPFKAGAFGRCVSMVQEQLRDLGYYKGAINGIYNSATAKAVVVFKKFHDFTSAAATVSKADREKIASEDALSYNTVYGPDTIKPGAKSAEVREVQIVLRELNYYRGAFDGKYTSAAYDAKIAESFAETDPAKRNELLHQAEDILIGQDFACAPIYYYADEYGVDPILKDWGITPVGYKFFHKAYIAE